MDVLRAIQMTGLTVQKYELHSSQFDFTEGITEQCSEAKVLIPK